MRGGGFAAQASTSAGWRNVTVPALRLERAPLRRGEVGRSRPPRSPATDSRGRPQTPAHLGRHGGLTPPGAPNGGTLRVQLVMDSAGHPRLR